MNFLLAKNSLIYFGKQAKYGRSNRSWSAETSSDLFVLYILQSATAWLKETHTHILGLNTIT